jgi:hypothetical protein
MKKALIFSAVLFVLAIVSVSFASQPATAQDTTSSQLVATTANTVVTVLTDEEAKQVVGGGWGEWCGLIVYDDRYVNLCELHGPPPGGCMGFFWATWYHRVCTTEGAYPDEWCDNNFYDVYYAATGCYWYEEYQECAPDNSAWIISSDWFCM